MANTPTVSPVAQALQILFNRSPRQIEILKGIQQPEAKYGLSDSIENRLTQVFVGYADVSSDRVTQYRDYDKMDLESTECQTGLDIFAEEASQPDSKTGLRIWVTSQDPKMADELNGMLQRMNMEAKAYGIYRNLVKYGDVFMYLLLGGYGVHDMYFVHPSRVERVQDDGLLGFKSMDIASLVQVDNKNALFKPWDFCLDNQSEILTPRGWLLFKDLLPNDQVATRNPTTKEFEWQQPTDYVNAPYDGEMIHFYSNALDMLVTPNHRMLVTTKGEGEHFEEAKTIFEDIRTKSSYKIPVTSGWKGEHIEQIVFEPEVKQITKTSKNNIVFTYALCNQKRIIITGDDYCALMGMYLSEGCLDSNRGVSIAQRATSKGFVKFKEILCKINGGKISHNGQAFRLYGKGITKFFRQFGYSHEKFIPSDIMNATRDQLKIFWDYYVLGDGWFLPKSKSNPEFTPVAISTSSKKMADQLMEIAQKLGYTASLHTFFAKETTITGVACTQRENYRITLRQAQEITFNKEKVTYNGTVHCVTVPNGTIYVRRNGMPVWTGNCHFRVLAYDRENVYGRSQMASMRKVWKQYAMLETMIVLYRIAKSVQRNIFYVDVGQASGPETTQILKEYEKFLKNKTSFVDPKTKEFRLDFNPATMLQDIVWPTRANSPSKVEYLQNTNQMGTLDDLEKFRNKIISAWGIPKAYFDGDLGEGLFNPNQALQLQDARFARKIRKFQDAMRDGIVRVCQIHWAITHGEYLDAKQITVNLGTISDGADRDREDIIIRKGQGLMLLAAVAEAMGWNKQVWSDYLLDQIFPLPPELRDKLFTPDPTTLLASQEGIHTIKNIQASGVDPAAVSALIGTSSKGKAGSYVSKRGQGSFMSPGGKLAKAGGGIKEGEESTDVEQLVEEMLQDFSAPSTTQPLTEEELTAIKESAARIQAQLPKVNGPESSSWKKSVKWKELFEMANPSEIKED